jgi:hypothetical protein
VLYDFHTPKLSNQNEVFIWFSVLIGCMICHSLHLTNSTVPYYQYLLKSTVVCNGFVFSIVFTYSTLISFLLLKLFWCAWLHVCIYLLWCKIWTQYHIIFVLLEMHVYFCTIVPFCNKIVDI